MTVDAPPRPAPALRRSLGSGSTTPERLFRVALVLIVGCLATALVSVLAGVQRSASVAEAQTRIAALTADSAELYRSLADADAMATSGYVSGGREPTAVRARYDDDIARATDRLVSAAGRLPGSEPVATIAAQLRLHGPRGVGAHAQPRRPAAGPVVPGQRVGAHAGHDPAGGRGAAPAAGRRAGRGLCARRRDPVRGRCAACGHVDCDRRRLAARAPPHPPHPQRRAAHRRRCAGGRAGVVGGGRRRGERPARDRAAAQ